MKKIVYIIPLLFLIAAFACQKDGYEEEEGTEGGSTIAATAEYVVFAWNDLGMHCLSPTYDEMVILPPYNTVNVQVVKRGEKPLIVTSGITVEYSLVDNTSSANKRAYGGFWTYFTKLFGGAAPAKDIGMKGFGLSGKMALNGDHYTADGIPIVPVNDNGTWNPYQAIAIRVKDAAGKEIASTRATVPTSDEMNCAKCHKAEDGLSVYAGILKEHDEVGGKKLLDMKPVLCASCHGSPALGATSPGSSGMYLSQAIHGYHAKESAAQCYDCHPGAQTKCSRSLEHMGSTGDGNCTTCHGNLANVASTIASGKRISWANEPQCASCHENVQGVATSGLYRMSKGHGGMYCESCHGSPHAMYPAREAIDNYQPNQYQGSKIKSIGNCGVCHSDSRGDSDLGDFAEKHGGLNPDKKTACNICHTSVSATVSKWPHAHTWTNTN